MFLLFCLFSLIDLRSCTLFWLKEIQCCIYSIVKYNLTLLIILICVIFSEYKILFVKEFAMMRFIIRESPVSRNTNLEKQIAYRSSSLQKVLISPSCDCRYLNTETLLDQGLRATEDKDYLKVRKV